MGRDQLLTYYRSLSHAERLELLTDQERVKAQLEADQQCLLAVIEEQPDSDAAPEILGKHFVRDEVACALRLSFGTARLRMEQAHELVSRLPSTWQLLSAGTIGAGHCRILLEATHRLEDGVAAKVEARVLPRAATQTAAEFRRSVRRAVAMLDPAGDTERHDEALEQRRVVRTDEPDGMASIWAYTSADGAEILMSCLTGLAGRTDPCDERSMDQRRADALVDLAADALDRVPAQHGRRPAVQVSVALSTLLGLDQQPGELAGYGPIPATLARSIAADPTGTWTRLVTDEHGRLIDYGTTRYRPPRNLADFVIARDHTCRMPGCHRTACTCDLDHRLPRSAGGPTNPANLHALCSRHHHLKHEAGWHVSRASDGTTIWTTPTGRRHDKPPSTYPIDRTTDPPDRADFA